MKLLTFAILLSSVAGFLAGCGDAPPPPPTERNALILRFFDSMAHADAAAASEQGEKLRMMDAGNDYVINLVTIQQSNAYLQRAQREINAGDIDAALTILNDGVKTYPANRELILQRGRVRQLRNAKRLLEAMQTAQASAAMSAALTAASTGLSSNMTPELQAYFDAYRLRIDEVARAEAARAAGTTAAKEPSIPAAPAVPAPPVTEK